MPEIATIEALWLMHTQDLTALWALPFFLFVLDELPDAQVPDAGEIFDHAHAILRPVALINVLDHFARVILTAVAIPRMAMRKILAILDLTPCTGLRFVRILPSTTRARLPFPPICHTQAAVHPAWRDQCAIHSSYTCGSFFHDQGFSSFWTIIGTIRAIR